MDAKTTIGRAIRILRDSAGLSQEKLAENADITYQYLSALENGKENFSIGILESISPFQRRLTKLQPRPLEVETKILSPWSKKLAVSVKTKNVADHERR